jgi:hypothetical protein
MVAHSRIGRGAVGQLLVDEVLGELEDVAATLTETWQPAAPISGKVATEAAPSLLGEQSPAGRKLVVYQRSEPTRL